MQTTHQIYFGLAQHMDAIADASVDLVVTSPPYPMVEMWDEGMGIQNPAITSALVRQDGSEAFSLMHNELDVVWNEVCRVTKPSAFVCINIGDATRTINGEFQLFSNHSRIIQYFLKRGFCCLPPILWRKPTNAPNKFMGSGMLPAGAYVTLEHEYILVFRKGGKRVFKSEQEKALRQQSAFFWEERNQWFSDLWEVRGTGQKLLNKNSRERSGAYPFEIPYRLINMYSVKGDVVLDPFLGTGTTALAALATGRNSIGYEMDETLAETLTEALSPDKVPLLNTLIRDRLQSHLDFVEKRLATGSWDVKHVNIHYQFPVVTSQEIDLLLNFLTHIEPSANLFTARYSTKPDFKAAYVPAQVGRQGQQILSF
ncbi:MAG: site-specific DNA-methyltransferase [Bacteroidetes bacterium]|nr:site-specific DNA-methyltransferase [Fibrella sp.]